MTTRTLCFLAAALFLTTSATAQIKGLASPTQTWGGYFGLGACSVPDVDGDGKNDVAVLDPNFYNTSNFSYGRVRIYSGASGSFIRSLIPTEGGTFKAAIIFQRGGIAGIPDVTGDGRGDIIVGAPSEWSGAGRAYVYSGATGSLYKILKSAGNEANGAFGYSVASVPDTDGDGKADVIVGAPYEDPGATPDDCGRAYLYSGATGILLKKIIPPASQLFGHFGNYVAGIGDINGDGRGDVLIGADNECTIPNQTLNEGRAHLYSGKTGVRLRTFLTPKAVQLGGFGEIVTAIPDVTGDAKPDILITAPGHDPNSQLPFSSGMAYLYNGVTGAYIRTFVSPNVEHDGWFGFSASGVPDMNGDGKGEILIGAPQETVSALSNAGRAYIFSGANGALFKTLVSPNKEADGNFGFAAAGLTTVNGGTKGDVLIGAPYEDPGLSLDDAGRAYIYKY